MEAANIEERQRSVMSMDLHGGGNLVSDRTWSSSESVWLAGKDVELEVSCSHCLQKEGTFPRQLRVSPECCANMAWGKGPFCLLALSKHGLCRW